MRKHVKIFSISKSKQNRKNLRFNLDIYANCKLFLFFQNLTCDNFSKKKKKIFLSNDGAKYLSKKNFVILKIRNLYAFSDLQVLRKLNVLKGTVTVT